MTPRPSQQPALRWAMPDNEEILERMKAISASSRVAYDAAAASVPALRRAAANIEQAHVLAEYTGRPVDTSYQGHGVTVFPFGWVPPRV